MRVAYIVKRYPRYSETFIVNEILAHERSGLDVRIYALLPPQDSHFQDIISRVRAPVTYLTAKAERASPFWKLQKNVAAKYPSVWSALGMFPEASAREVLQALELASFIHKKRITHLHAHFATTSTTVAQIASAITSVPYTFTAHAKDIFHNDNNFDVLKEKFSHSKLAITVSNFNVRYLGEELHISPEKIKKIYNGLNLTDFLFLSPFQRPMKVCAIGRLVEKKGFSDLISACHILKNKQIDFTCEIIGDGELKSSLEQQIKALDLTNYVVMSGSLPQVEIKQRLHQSAVFAAPCVVGVDGNRDGLPTVLLESMALGTPCVSTSVTGIPEVITDNETGLLAKQNDPASLASAIETLLLNSELRLKLANNARQLIEQKFDIDINAEKIRQCFEYQPLKPSISEESTL
ncbi:glycosyltransferase family 4 protein [Vibrio sp. ZSDE26]|uniref:Glycosyltransferase family 4 protein n=1 Tax=Vibrio amylolyticus TaxID=2847292 RepID=A0A9X1XJI9_9VIBR|nr:glycosyltransferase family 4 protein [Vibrio amylolyticus]MCK6262120.1 glycosyltransferase family 4 protein [Vibrio amylolyticus]